MIQRSSLHSITVTALLILAATRGHAETAFLPDPVALSASSSFSAAWAPEFLFDASPTASDLETLFAAGSAQQYAGQGAGPHVIVYDFGSTVTFRGLAYSQRAGSDPALDKVQNIDVWVTDTDPGAAATDLPILSDPADANTGQVLTADTTFRNYDLGAELSGRWVVLRLNDAGGAVGNPGGSELHLTVETGPADPDLVAPGAFDLGSVEADETLLQGTIPISNAGAAQTLTISDITFIGGDSGNFAVSASPSTLDAGVAGEIVVNFTPGAELRDYVATMVITSTDSNTAMTPVELTARVTTAVPNNLELLPDPNSVTASTFFSAAFAPEFLFDSDLSVDDVENLTFVEQDQQYAGQGTGPHILVLDYGNAVTFDSFVYAQRRGGNPTTDKVPGIEFWVTDTDPGAAAPDLPILSNAADASVTGLTTTDSILHYYSLGAALSGRYVVIRLAQGNGNAGGAELNLSLAAPLAGLAITRVVYADDAGSKTVELTWDSIPGAIYTIRRTPDFALQFIDWEELTDDTVSGATETTYLDTTLPLDAPRMFYKVKQN